MSSICPPSALYTVMAPPLTQGKLPRLPQPRVAHHRPPRRADSRSAGFTPPPRPLLSLRCPLLSPCCPPLGLAAPMAAFPTASCRASQVAASHLSPNPPGGGTFLARGMGTTQEGVGVGVVYCQCPQPGRASLDDSHSVRRAGGGRYRHTTEVRRPLPIVHQLIHVPCFPPLLLFFSSFPAPLFLFFSPCALLFFFQSAATPGSPTPHQSLPHPPAPPGRPWPAAHQQPQSLGHRALAQLHVRGCRLILK